MSSISDLLHKEQPKKKEEDRYCILNFPYKFLLSDGSWLKPDTFGFYSPKNKMEVAELEYQMKQGKVYKESQLVPAETE